MRVRVRVRVRVKVRGRGRGRERGRGRGRGRVRVRVRVSLGEEGVGHTRKQTLEVWAEDDIGRTERKMREEMRRNKRQIRE